MHIQHKKESVWLDIGKKRPAKKEKRPAPGRWKVGEIKDVPKLIDSGNLFRSIRGYRSKVTPPG